MQRSKKVCFFLPFEMWWSRSTKHQRMKYLKTVPKYSTCVNVLCTTVFIQVLLPLCPIYRGLWLIINLNPHATDKRPVQQVFRTYIF